MIPLHSVTLIYTNGVDPERMRLQIRLLHGLFQEVVQVLSDAKPLTVYEYPLAAIISTPNVGQAEVNARSRCVSDLALDEAV